MDVAAFFKAEFAEHDTVARATEAALGQPPSPACSRPASQSIRGGGKLMFFGNGGSAADAQHLATELTVRYKRNRAAIAALALTTDTSALTAAGNDLGFDQIFARQIEALGRPATWPSPSRPPARARMSLRRCAPGEGAWAWSPRHSAAKAAATWRRSPIICWRCRRPPPRASRRCTSLLGQMLCGALEIELGLAGR